MSALKQLGHHTREGGINHLKAQAGHRKLPEPLIR